MSEPTAGGDPWLMRTPPLEAVTCLFFFALFLVVFVRHLYVTGFLGQIRLAHLAQEVEGRAQAQVRGRLNARIRAFIDLVTDSAYAHAAAAQLQLQNHCRGLDAAAFKALPEVAFRPEDFKAGVECAVCLGELTAGEAVRPLPQCGHVFHVECIDMWFFSHSTCPLCRSPVLPEPIREVGSVSLNPPAEVLPPSAFDRTIGAHLISQEQSSSSSPSRTAGAVVIEIPSPAPSQPEGVLCSRKDVERPEAAEGSGSSREGDIEEGCVPARAQTTSTAERRP